MSSIPSDRNLSDLGPDHDVYWVEGPRVRAKQAEMLEIDVSFSAQWVEKMTSLVALNLDDQDFTMQRMAALHAWERARKRAQKNLHWKYDPVHRKRHLVERDVERKLAEMKVQIKEMAERLDAQTARKEKGLLAVVPETPARRSPRRTAPLVPRAARPRLPVSHPGLDTMDPGILEMLRKDFKGMDLNTSTDDEIIADLALRGVEDPSEYLSMINGTPDE